MTTVFETPADLLAAVGTDLGATDWVTITQDRIDQFADATGDHQWIHVDPVKAAEGPFGAPIAHGYLTLALTNLFLPDLIVVEKISMGVNYGVNKVRFPSPVTVGSKIRASGEIAEVTDVAGGVQMVTRVTIETEGGGKPACVAETVNRFLFD